MRMPLALRLPRPPMPLDLVQKLPRLLLKPVNHSPFIMQRLLAETVLSHIFREALLDGDFDFLRGKHIKVDIRDLNLYGYFSCNGQRLTLVRQARADVTIRGDFREFLLLASRQEDPDTLFFQRRLQIDGDTELGLEVKNMLDTIDLDNLPEPIRNGLDRIVKLLV